MKKELGACLIALFLKTEKKNIIGEVFCVYVFSESVSVFCFLFTRIQKPKQLKDVLVLCFYFLLRKHVKTQRIGVFIHGIIINMIS